MNFVILFYLLLKVISKDLVLQQDGNNLLNDCCPLCLYQLSFKIAVHRNHYRKILACHTTLARWILRYKFKLLNLYRLNKVLLSLCNSYEVLSLGVVTHTLLINIKKYFNLYINNTSEPRHLIKWYLYLTKTCSKNVWRFCPKFFIYIYS